MTKNIALCILKFAILRYNVNVSVGKSQYDARVSFGNIIINEILFRKYCNGGFVTGFLSSI